MLTLLIIIRDIPISIIRYTCTFLYTATTSCVSTICTGIKKVVKETMKCTEIYQLKRMIMLNKLRDYVLEVKMAGIKGNGGIYSSLEPKKLTLEDLKILVEDVRFILYDGLYSEEKNTHNVKLLELLDIFEYQGTTSTKVKMKYLESNEVCEIIFTYSTLVELLYNSHLSGNDVPRIPKSHTRFLQSHVFDPSVPSRLRKVSVSSLFT